MHPLAQWELVSQPLDTARGTVPFTQPPRMGALPISQLSRLCELSAKSTGTPELCFSGYWDGFGWVPYSDLTEAPELVLDQRTYLIKPCSLNKPVEAIWRVPGTDLTSEPPTVVWPSDRTWFIASDPDLDSTLVGGSAALVAAILDNRALEAWPVAANDAASGGDPGP
jgi:hypothetical protein